VLGLLAYAIRPTCGKQDQRVALADDRVEDLVGVLDRLVLVAGLEEFVPLLGLRLDEVLAVLAVRQRAVDVKQYDVVHSQSPIQLVISMDIVVRRSCWRPRGSVPAL